MSRFQIPIVTGYYGYNDVSGAELGSDQQAKHDIIAPGSSVPDVLPPAIPQYRTSIIPQGQYSHKTKAGRTRYGSTASSESDAVSFCLKDSWDIGVPLQSALHSCEDLDLLGAQDEVLRGQGVNITLHILVRSVMPLYLYRAGI